MIPKIVHYCWLGEKDYPPLVKRCIASWKKILPGWEFRLWDKRCLDEIDCDWVKEAYKAKAFAHASDYIRLYAVYKYGGFYLDSDVEMIKDFSPLLSNTYVFGMERGTGHIEAATYGAEPLNPFIRECMDYYQRLHYINEDGTNNMNICSPHVMTQIAGDFTIIQAINEFDPAQNKLQIFTADFFSPKSHISNRLTITEDTFSIHHFRVSWMPIRKKTSIRLRRLLGSRISEPLFHIWAFIKKLF